MRDAPRLLVPHPLHEGAAIPLSPSQAHYLVSVLRLPPGAPLRLFNGRDGEWSARLALRGPATARASRAPAWAELQSPLRPQSPEPDLWLLFAPLKRDATDLVVQKATELGVSAVLPVLTERTNTPRLNQARLEAIAAEAAEQCERLTLPVLHPLRPLGEILAGWAPGRPLACALERTDAPPLRPRPETHPSSPSGPGPATPPAALLIGPEGGFTPRELDALRRHPFVLPVTLGPRILRAETAAIVGLALLQASLPQAPAAERAADGPDPIC